MSDLLAPIVVGHQALLKALRLKVSVGVVAKPVNTVLPSISGTPQQGETLTGSLGTWTGADSFVRAWTRDGALISGASGATYVPQAADVGKIIKFEPAAVNTLGSTKAVSLGVGPVVAAVMPTTPIITSGASFSTPENVLYSQTATASGGGTMTWAKGGDDAALVTLNTGTGEWSLTGNYETDPSIAFTLAATNSAGSSAPQAITVTINDVAEPGTGTPLSAAELTRTSGVTTYPVTASFTRPIDWADVPTMHAVMQISADPLFGSGVTETVLQILAATLTYDFNLDTIVTPQVRYFRLGAWIGAAGDRPSDGAMNWSNVQGVGDAVVPVITGGTTSSAERAVVSVTVISSEASYFTLGGADALLLEKVGSEPATSISVRLLANAVSDFETKASYSFTVTPTDPIGNVGTAAAFTHNITNVVENPAFTFTDETGIAVSTLKTSNTITVSGLPSGYAAPMTFSGSGGYIKNGGALATAATTVVNGDTLAIQLTSSGSGATSTTGTITVGGDAAQFSESYSVTTAGFTPADLWLASETGDWWDVTDMGTMWQDTGGTVPAAVGSQVKRWVGKKNGMVLAPVATNGPILRNDGTNNYLEHTGAGTAAALKIASAQFVNATDGTVTLATACSFSNTTSSRSAVSLDSGSGTGRILRLDQNTTVSNVTGFSNLGQATDPSGQTVAANTPFSWMGLRTTTTVESYHNGLSNGATTRTGTNNTAVSPLEIAYVSSSYQATQTNIYAGVIAIGRTITGPEVASLHTWLDARS